MENTNTNTNFIKLESNEQWEKLYNSDKKLLVDFTATWCGPCQQIAPIFKDLSIEYKDIYFVKVDVDEYDEITESMKIECMPTFHFIKNKTIIYTLTGANEIQLKTYTSVFNEYIDQTSDSLESSESETKLV